MTWKFAIKIYLLKKSDLWIYIDSIDQNLPCDAKTLPYIAEGVSETIFNDIRDLSSGKEAWKVLVENYEDKGIGG